MGRHPVRSDGLGQASNVRDRSVSSGSPGDVCAVLREPKRAVRFGSEAECRMWSDKLRDHSDCGDPSDLAGRALQIAPSGPAVMLLTVAPTVYVVQQ
jgi:hypothetical protein